MKELSVRFITTEKIESVLQIVIFKNANFLLLWDGDRAM